MKSLRQIVELKKIDLVPDPDLQAGQVSNYANPKSEAEKRFVDKHFDNVQQQLHPAFKNEAEQDAVFKGGNISKDETHDNAGAGHYKDGADAEVYEQAIKLVRENLTEENVEFQYKQFIRPGDKIAFFSGSGTFHVAKVTKLY